MNSFGILKDKFGNIMRQMVKYGLVGVINTIITMIVLFVLQNAFGVSYKLANGAGYVCGFINSFILNKFWTFKGNQKSTLSQFIRFSLVFAVCYAMQLGFVVLLVEKMHIEKNISQLIGMVFYTLISFLLNKVFTFKN
ncbi:GtrA family protein [Ruminiclostridium cellulolyticum]|uniref:GtrA family protein n=1 Tax=Ruminiclostridium cellulolyticum (strain ATCC 35319 / DSM 5812 / JCM 6584 / H10) TaxID=394503 RepID=B8I5R9_RUMCH|nr:GtrA family protein [Ruminiclostridium cellulolyticum]ACL74736.1 GtrA family protein [Ruminiclostridium cellulolyticum H10]